MSYPISLYQYRYGKPDSLLQWLSLLLLLLLSVLRPLLHLVLLLLLLLLLLSALQPVLILRPSMQLPLFLLRFNHSPLLHLLW